MKIVVVGGSGRIGEKLVYNLRQDDYRVLEASPSFGVNTVTREGLDTALTGADVVVDVTQAPALDGPSALAFFEASGRNLLAAAKVAGVRHHVALSIVGTDRLQASGYFQAKKLQEDLIKASGLPYSILRSTQFFEFISGVVQDGTARDVVISPAQVQPIAAEDVAETLADIALSPPLNGTVEVAGPDRYRLHELAREVLTALEDPRQVTPDQDAPYFGARLSDASLLPGEAPLIAETRFHDWLSASLQATPIVHQRRQG
ncbi:NmrA family transcriptional regulator [Caulobacter flavus]|uniref:NmrA family transcriptional regulator n=1 Tax=Caulobacter flavus TaxID=1679497 RepID=A0A2N5CKH9_9CAUL|nr:NAD(P)H-binding protein [Caulobacter flavus]AYV47671.1 NmrA family transcriptional regulator [Caulobacter flavus]PLR05831.1 NmrA family transcriptional regulator [Caulobacter flavus]